MIREKIGPYYPGARCGTQPHSGSHPTSQPATFPITRNHALPIALPNPDTFFALACTAQLAATPNAFSLAFPLPPQEMDRSMDAIEAPARLRSVMGRPLQREGKGDDDK